MRLERLRFAALGPYAGEHLIDFELLGGSGLFIIEGPTGGGKSTILDAMVFALYGDVAGSDSDKQRLRSGFADASVESFAEVEFSTASGRYRVRRTPEFMRARRNGEGEEVPARSTIQFWRATGEHGWDLVSKAHREAEIEIQAVVGLDKSQFLQTVVLPQGEFSKFLKAKSAERQAILEQVFATGVFARLQEWADVQRKAAELEIKARADRLRDSVQQLVGRIDSDDEALADAHAALSDPEATPESIAAAIADAVARVAERLATAEVEAQRLAADVGKREELLGRVRGWRAAQKSLATAIDAVEAAMRSAESARTAADSHVDTIAALTGTPVDLIDPAEVIRGIDVAIGALEAVTQQGAVRETLVLDCQALEQSVSEDEAAAGRLADERDQELPARLAWCAAELDRVSRSLTDAYAAAASEREILIRSRMDGMAGELAASLVDGDPCPVCGAAEHPDPAEISSSAATPDEIEAAGRRTESLSADRLAMMPDVAGARDLVAQVGGFEGEPAAETGNPSVVLARIRLRLKEIGEELPRLHERSAARRKRAAELTESIAEIDRQLIDAAAEFDSVDDRLAAMEAIREDITALASARAALGEATRAQAQAQAVLDALDEPIVEDGLEADGVLEAQLIEARSVATAAIVSAEAARTLLDDIGRLSTGVENARSERDRTRQEWAATISLAETLNGRGANQLAQPLKAYVLQQMFDEVLDAANARLSGMLEGRFALVDTEQAQGRERIKGLGIEIMDRFTDSVRRADTLSGGETFCAALALALGLADTVRAHAGGIDIGMLFVDEGFGSLDPDRLDDVMAELMRLRADGRTVGVISHVSEMKRSILERISVRSVGPGAGSTLTVTWMAE